LRTCDPREKGASEGGGSACMAHPTMLGGRRMLADLLGKGECLVEEKTRFSGNRSLPAAILSARRLAYDRQASRREVLHVASDLVTIPCSRTECRSNSTRWAASGRVGRHAAGGLAPSLPSRRDVPKDSRTSTPRGQAAPANCPMTNRLAFVAGRTLPGTADLAGQALMKGLKGLAKLWDRGGGVGRTHAC